MKTNPEIRAAARAMLGNNIFSNAWLYALAAVLLTSIVYSITSSFFVGIILTGPIFIGLAYYFLKLAREGKADFNDLLYATTNDNFVRTMLVGLLEVVFLALWSIIPFVGIVKYYSYMLTPYIAVDRPELGANDCITESRRLMEGHKMQAFLLDLSFIGWLILGSCVCGIGTIFVAPYMEAARVAFYEEIKAKAAPAAEVAA